jgi:hypothetical protein
MNKRIIYPNDDGGVAIVIPAPEYLASHTIEELIAKDVPIGKSYKIVDASNIPEDFTFRNAWELVDGEIVVNKAKKQAIIDAQQAPIIAKESALTKLAALGLTQDEVKALVG